MLPEYFFHLVFELHPPPPSESRSPTQQHYFIPPRGTDLFKARLPVHPLSSWSKSQSSKKGHRRTKTGGLDGENVRPQLSKRRYSNLTPTSPGDRRDSPVPSHVRTPVNGTDVDAVGKDWRFDNIRIQSIDMEAHHGDSTTQSRADAASKSLTGVQAHRSTKARYVPSNARDTDAGWGVVHLYRDVDETPGLYDDGTSSDGSENGQPDTSNSQAFNENDCTTLCILAVPAYYSPTDVLEYFGPETRDQVSHFRFIKTRRANRYMVLLKFREAKAAREWRKEWNGKTFDTMEVSCLKAFFSKLLANSCNFRLNISTLSSSSPLSSTAMTIGIPLAFQT